MMAGNPSWWSMHPPNSHHQPSNTLLSSSSSSSPSQYVLGSSSSSSSSFPFNSLPDSQVHPQSWSQLLVGGFPGEEDRFNTTPSIHYQPKKFENWEDHHHHHQQIITNQSSPRVSIVDVNHEVPQTNNLYLHGIEEFHRASATWPKIMPPVSPRSCVTSLSNNILDFSSTKPAVDNNKHNQQLKDHSSECNSTATGGLNKKARVQVSSSQPPLKVRKEKLGDRITSLHQLVSPFGKTDTASVLLEAIGYIRFLQGQIEALSSAYLTSSSSANMRNQHCGAFPEDLGQDDQSKPKDLRSIGLCLVPVSCTQQVGSDNGADYWSPALGGGF